MKNITSLLKLLPFYFNGGNNKQQFTIKLDDPRIKSESLNKELLIRYLESDVIFIESNDEKLN